MPPFGTLYLADVNVLHLYQVSTAGNPPNHVHPFSTPTVVPPAVVGMWIYLQGAVLGQGTLELTSNYSRIAFR